ncbi:MAG: hypothetical protein JXA23_04315 [Bacteroidales bacterium]|nr:hypothetical protein [Bacteroidales bacterium]
MEHTFSEKESLDLIRKMIDTAKNNLQQGTGKVFLLWGYLVAGISLATIILLITLPGDTRYYAYYLWFFMAFGAPFMLCLCAIAGYIIPGHLLRKKEGSDAART